MSLQMGAWAGTITEADYVASLTNFFSRNRLHFRRNNKISQPLKNEKLRPHFNKDKA